MRAIVFDQFGEPAEVLTLREGTTPEPRPGEVRVRMLASPVNPSDLMTVRGKYGILPKLPATPGFEGVGTVQASGGGLYGKMLVGKRVAVLNRDRGNWCDFTTLPAKQAIPLPDDLPLEQAAMFFVNPATAYAMTRLVLKIPKGAWLVQTAAGSALGRMVIRLGRRFGFHTLNVVRRAEQIEELKALGGDVVLSFDAARHDAEQFREDLMLVTGGTGVPFAIDPVGGKTTAVVSACLAENGKMLVYGTLADEFSTFSARWLMGTGSSIHGFWLARFMQQQGLLSKLRLVKKITRLMREGVLVSDVGESFPLEQITDAVRAAERPGRGGKILLRISEPE